MPAKASKLPNVLHSTLSRFVVRIAQSSGYRTSAPDSGRDDRAVRAVRVELESDEIQKRLFRKLHFRLDGSYGSFLWLNVTGGLNPSLSTTDIDKGKATRNTVVEIILLIASSLACLAACSASLFGYKNDRARLQTKLPDVQIHLPYKGPFRNQAIPLSAKIKMSQPTQTGRSLGSTFQQRRLQKRVRQIETQEMRNGLLPMNLIYHQAPRGAEGLGPSWD